MSNYYDRDGKLRPFEEIATIESAARARGEDYRRIARTKVPGADSTVSTVWLGLDHQFGDGPPLIFESLVFGGGMDGEMERYSTEAEARAGHDALVAKVRAEHAAFVTLAADPDVAAAVRLIQERITAHLTAFGVCDYEGNAWSRLVKEVTGTVTEP